MERGVASSSLSTPRQLFLPYDLRNYLPLLLQTVLVQLPERGSVTSLAIITDRESLHWFFLSTIHTAANDGEKRFFHHHKVRCGIKFASVQHPASCFAYLYFSTLRRRYDIIG
jgi:hypothetical protein